LLDGGQAATPLQKSGRNGEPNSRGEKAVTAPRHDRAAAHDEDVPTIRPAVWQAFKLEQREVVATMPSLPILAAR
jgi:hypothetical protein